MVCDLDIAFLGGLFSGDLENEVYEKSKGYVQTAANALQWNIVEGLDQNCKKPVKILNSLYIGSYPGHYKTPFIKTYPFSHIDSAKDINVGFINLFLVKHFSRYLSLKPYIKNWALDKSGDKVLIGYALSLEFIMGLNYAKRINPKVKTIIIIPDLLEYMNTSDKVSLIYRILKNAESHNILKKLNKIDGFVILTKYMKEALGIGNNYVVMEGIATDIPYIDIREEKDNKIKKILYTGTLNKKYGILNLVEAFKMIPSGDYRLILCGSGDSEEKIKEESLKDSRIIFKGLVHRDEVLKLQREATVLVNPRLNNEEYTKYSFPSKLLEYLSSGTPVIAYKLDGIPDEYDDFIYYIEGDSIIHLKDRIVEICEKDSKELLGFGERSRIFTVTDKNKRAQTRKIIELALEL